MRSDEARDLGRLGAVVLAGAARRVQEVQEAVAGRAFRAVGPAATPVRAVHDAVSTGVHAAVRTGLAGGARAAGLAGALVADGTPVEQRRSARTALAVANGTHGDLLRDVAPALALRATVRADGRDVPLEPAALRNAYPHARSTVVVLLHGLTEDERAWCFRSLRHHGRPGVSFATLLEHDLPCTAVLVRYPTGLHVSENGRAVAALLDGLVAAWPVPVRDLVLVGHSMGGLVARSALHAAGGGTDDAAAWTRLVRDTVTLGTPHLGAPLERAAHRAGHLLRRLPETRPVATLLSTRSAGVKDLRHGTLVEDDWSGHDPDAPERGPHTLVPLHDGARHFAVLTTIARDPSSRLGRLLGDGLVTPDSAVGEGALAFPADHVHRLGGLHHFDLLSEPRVYGQLLAWLRDRPAPADDPAAS
ncbi:MAG TPA: alpha/beta hydrolase [Mycobacteriales bacterium]|nr:alpha/beta hydrolase [Mycobacteriales bacterium]